MIRKGLLMLIFGLLFMVAVACSDSEETSNNDEGEDTEEVKQEENDVDESQQQEEETSETEDEENNEEVVEDEEEIAESTIPDDEVLLGVIEENSETIMNKAEAQHMETIHSESPSYEGTKQVFEQLSLYTLDITLSDLVIEGKTEEEARIAYTQTTVKVDGPAFENNKVIGVHVLRPEDGVWKIYATEVIEIVYLDENGEELDNSNPSSEGVVMEGAYADIITNLEMPFDSEKWVLGNYQEIQGEALVEFLVSGEDFENYTELLSLHYYEDGKDYIGAEFLVDAMEENLITMVSGDLEFNRLEETDAEVLFEFNITGDPVELDQEELGRAFIKDNDLYVIRYTTIEKAIENKEEWIEKLKGVQ